MHKKTWVVKLEHPESDSTWSEIVEAVDEREAEELIMKEMEFSSEAGLINVIKIYPKLRFKA